MEEEPSPPGKGPEPGNKYGEDHPLQKRLPAYSAAAAGPEVHPSYIPGFSGGVRATLSNTTGVPTPRLVHVGVEF